MSFSVGCNLEGVATEHQSSKDPGELLSQFIDVLMEMAKKKYEACIGHYEHIFIMMDGLLERERSRMESVNPCTFTGDDLIKDKKGKVISTTLLKELENISARFESYCRELSVFGFNSAGYDIKLIKKFLFKELCKLDESPSFTVKKAGKYPCIKSESLKFLDILQFLATGYNLRSFFKAFDANVEKVSSPMTISYLQNNLTRPHSLSIKLFTRPSRTVTSWKKTMLHFKNLSTKENLNKKPSMFYVCRKYRKLVLKIMNGLTTFGMKMAGQRLQITFNGTMI